MVNARMLDQRRERVRRWSTVLLCLVALVAAGWLMVQGGRFFGRLMFSRNPLYTIAQLDVRSDGHHIPASLILEFAELQAGMNLFAIDLRDVQSKLEEVSLVYRARVNRALPDTLRIRVTERVAVARLGPDSARYPLAVDRFGVVLGRRSRASSLPMITGASFLMRGPEDKALRPGKVVQDERILDALTVIDLCDSNPRLARLMNLERIDISADDILTLYTASGKPGDPAVRESELSRELAFDEQMKKLAATFQYIDATGRVFDESKFNFTVKQNQAIQ